MIKLRKIKKKWFLGLLSGLLISTSLITLTTWAKKKHQRSEALKIQRKNSLIVEKLTSNIIEKNVFSENITIEEESLNIKYTIKPKLQKYIEKLLRRYRSDSSSVVVLDNSTGKILAFTGWDRNKGRSLKIPITADHPSASLAKIISSADLLENTNITTESRFSYRGKGTTLYKYQLRDKITKWTRYLNLERAFAKSNNVIFAKAAIQNTSAPSLFKTAQKFGFNKEIVSDLRVDKSIFLMPKDQYNLAEIASGFNKEVLISPMHAAVLSSITANNGLLLRPRIIEKIMTEKGFKHILQRKKEIKVISSKSAKSLRKMMERTVKSGTARGSFKRLGKKIRENLNIGGKTGSITGGIPYGKRDWFTMYAIPKEKSSDNGISIAVMNVNIKKWYVKSTYLARKIMEFYFKTSIENKSLLTKNN